MTNRSRRQLFRVGGPVLAVLVGLATSCGLFVSPGDYTSGGGGDQDASLDRSSDGNVVSSDGNVILPDGNVVPASIGTLALVAGTREPTSPDDQPGWSSDAWSGILDANGRVATWTITKSAPIVGPFECSAVIANRWVMINFGFGIGSGQGTGIQTTSWGPGIVGDWVGARATGTPGYPDQPSRVFFGAHLAYIGGTHTDPGVDGGPPSTFFISTVYASDVDAPNNQLLSAADTGSKLVVARNRAGLAFGAGAIYVVGGRVNNGISASVEMAKADPVAGSVQAFTEQPPLTDNGVEHKVILPSVAVSDGYLWVAGGRTTFAGAPTDVLLSAKIDAATGALGAWKSVTKLPQQLRDFAFVPFKGRLYVAGGVNAALARSDLVYSAVINATDGSIGAWDTTHAKLPGPRADFAAQAY